MPLVSAVMLIGVLLALSVPAGAHDDPRLRFVDPRLHFLDEELRSLRRQVEEQARDIDRLEDRIDELERERALKTRQSTPQERIEAHRKLCAGLSEPERRETYACDPGPGGEDYQATDPCLKPIDVIGRLLLGCP